MHVNVSSDSIGLSKSRGREVVTPCAPREQESQQRMSSPTDGTMGEKTRGSVNLTMGEKNLGVLL